jgi:hypothetical protein
MTSTLIDHPDPPADVAPRRPTSPILAEQHWRRVSAQRADAYGEPDNVIVARWEVTAGLMNLLPGHSRQPIQELVLVAQTNLCR